MVPIESLAPGAVVLVRAGDSIPVDGTVTSGAAAVNEASITGESVPVDKGSGDSVLAGTIAESGALDVRTDKVGADTLFARIVALVEEAESETAPVQKLADRVAAWLLPLVLVFLIVVFFLTRDVRKIVALFICTSPAELGLATPMVMIAAIARAARLGILVKGGLYLERLAKVDTSCSTRPGRSRTEPWWSPRLPCMTLRSPKARSSGSRHRRTSAPGIPSQAPLSRARVIAA
jgi:Zn2+/Cd2+-exporting ATPase